MTWHIDDSGWLQSSACEHVESPHFDERPSGADVDLLVVHGISLPAGQFGGPYINDLFMGVLDPSAHDDFPAIADLRVSAHCLIRRTGEVVQYVSFDKRAWHAGVSSWCGKERCNDFSIGIELEGTDTTPYTEAQYQQLAALTVAIQSRYRAVKDDRIVGHCDIAPGRKTDPGDAFAWSDYFSRLAALR